MLGTVCMLAVFLNQTVFCVSFCIKQWLCHSERGLMLSSNQGVPVLAVNASAVLSCTAGAGLASAVDRLPAESLQPSHYITPAGNHWKELDMT